MLINFCHNWTHCIICHSAKKQTKKNIFSHWMLKYSWVMSFLRALCRMLRSPWLRTEPCSSYLTSVSFIPHFPANWRRARAPGPSKTPGSVYATCSLFFFKKPSHFPGKEWVWRHLLCGKPPTTSMKLWKARSLPVLPMGSTSSLDSSLSQINALR